jgi:hypothetical protein
MTGETDFSDELPPDDQTPESFETAKPAALAVAKSETPVRPAGWAMDDILPEYRITPRPTSAITGRTLPHSLEAEEQLLSCCLLDGSDTIARCQEAHLSAAAFFNPQNRAIYEWAINAHTKGMPVDLQIMAEDLRATGRLEAVGGINHLVKVSSLIGTTAQASYFIERVKDTHTQRELIKLATGAIEGAYGCNGNITELLAETQTRINQLGHSGPNGAGHGVTEFTVPLKGDPSILLGDRYLNRGDGGVIVSTSGMGKSSMSIQAATCWALGRDFFGIKPNGKLKSLIVQSEDSDGDIGEVIASIRHAMKLTADEHQAVGGNVIIHTERVARGAVFMAVLRRLISKHKPDLVWVNPLQAFMDGDVTQGKDLSAFLRAGLNQLNEPPTFGYIIVHHTTKPATGKERADRLWHEVMYDMAGGAEIINWARFIISLRAAANEGEFNLHLAKRGRRAGVVKMVEQGAGFYPEPVTKIALRHSQDRITLPGHADSIPVVFWEGRDADVEEEKPEKKKGGPPEKYPFSALKSVFPLRSEPGKKLAELHRAAIQNVPISLKTMHSVMQRYATDGMIEIIDRPNEVKRYRLAV